MIESEIEISPRLALSCNYDLLEKEIEKFNLRRLDTFDRWLNEDEAAKLILSYPVIVDEKKDLSTYYKHEENFIAFLLTVYRNHNICLCLEDSHLKFEDEDEFIESCKSMLREEKAPLLHVPELEISFRGGFDLSIGFYFANDNGLKILTRYLSDFDHLYLLE